MEQKIWKNDQFLSVECELGLFVYEKAVEESLLSTRQNKDHETSVNEEQMAD